jgi:hypothetical protein
MISKARVRQWLKRVRLDVRDIESVLKRPGPLTRADLDDIHEWGMDISGAGGEIASMIEELDD